MYWYNVLVKKVEFPLKYSPTAVRQRCVSRNDIGVKNKLGVFRAICLQCSSKKLSFPCRINWMNESSFNKKTNQHYVDVLFYWRFFIARRNCKSSTGLIVASFQGEQSKQKFDSHTFHPYINIKIRWSKLKVTPQPL